MRGEHAVREGSAVSLVAAATALGVLLIAVALLWQAAQSRASGGGFAPPGPIGSLQSVQLSDGLVLYGILAGVGGDTVRLEPVYEVDAGRLVRRHAGDWHGPGAMAIPVRQVLFMEAVPADSQAAKLIRADEAPGH